MSGLSWGDWAMVIVLCLGFATLAVFWIIRRAPHTATDGVKRANPVSHSIVFLFNGSELCDASGSAQHLIENAGTDDDIAGIGQVLRPRFPELPMDFVNHTGADQRTIASSDPEDTAKLMIEWSGDTTRLEVVEAGIQDIEPAYRHSQAVEKTELSILRQAMECAPYPVWQIADSDGATLWCNPAYDALQNRLAEDESGPVFDLGAIDRVKSGRIRTSVDLDSSHQTGWFDIFISRGDGRTFCHAINVDMVVNAEAARRNFVQTLTKTFAELSIGLAIFDRNRQLVLFNPALIDLTTLSAEFLSSRPNLLSFFDRLRDNRMMPEPKDYKSWREQIADLVASATSGNYVETWTLPSGPTYKVSGRPHPDGAIAFLIEDISAEISLTRRFQLELELGQSVLDMLDEAVVVFSSSGSLTLYNAAYRNLWMADPDSSFVDMTILDAIRHFQAQSRATPLFGELRDFVLECTERADWDGHITLNSGQELLCQIHPLSGGATLVRFLKNQDTPTVDKVPALNTADPI